MSCITSVNRDADSGSNIASIRKEEMTVRRAVIGIIQDKIIKCANSFEVK